MSKKTFLRIIMGLLTVGALSSGHAALDVAGYFDMEYIMKKEERPYFRQHHLNLLLQHSVDIYSFMAEIEFEDAVDMDYGRTPVHNDQDVKNEDVTKQGRVYIERAYGEAAFSRWATVRVGQLLHSSYYYQNHFPSITVNFTAPQTLNTIFDYNIKGAWLYGVAGGYYYDVWTGRGPKVNDDPENNENGPNMGGKVGSIFSFGRNRSLTLSYITASYANKRNVAANDTSHGLEFIGNFRNFNFWSEYGTRQDGESTSENIRAGYMIAYYSMDIGGQGELLPFVMWDSKKVEKNRDAIDRYAIGATYRPVPNISYKVEYLVTPEHKTTTIERETNQVSLAFIYFYH